MLIGSPKLSGLTVQKTSSPQGVLFLSLISLFPFRENPKRSYHKNDTLIQLFRLSEENGRRGARG